MKNLQVSQVSCATAVLGIPRNLVLPIHNIKAMLISRWVGPEAEASSMDGEIRVVGIDFAEGEAAAAISIDIQGAPRKEI